MKRTFKWLGSLALALVLCILIFPALTTEADAATYGDLTYEITDGKVTITDCDHSASGELVIPATIKGYSVTTIDYRAFSLCSNLTGITIPNSVTSIGAYAFSMCSNLTSITIPSSVTTIGDRAFEGCRNLTGIWVNENNPCYSSDSKGVLFNKDKTTLIQAPERISGAYVIPNSVTCIGKFAFSGCNSLTGITITDNVATIEIHAFSPCDNLTGFQVNENNPNYSSDEKGVLFNKDQTTLIEVPIKITGTYVIPNSTTTFADNFVGCTGLTSITIPKSVVAIGESAFYGCDNLQTVYYCGSQSQWQSVIVYRSNNTLENATKVYVQMVKKGSDWYCYRNGKLDTRADTLQWYNGKTYHLKNGKWQQGETKLYKYGSKWYYLVNGVVNYSDKLVKFDNKWYHVKDGTWQQGEHALYTYSGKQYYLYNGMWKNGITKLLSFDGKYYYLVNGVVNTSNKLVKLDNKWYHVKNGTWQKGETALFSYSGRYYYLVNGIMNTADKLVKFDGKWYHVKNGYWQQGENKLYKYNGEWYALKNGVMYTAKTLFPYSGKLYYISGGKWVRTNTTVTYNGKTYKVVNGIGQA